MIPKDAIGFFDAVDISAMVAEIMPEKILAIKPYEFYKKFSRDEIVNFLVKKGVYVLPTTELIDYLKAKIIGNAIEIGAGNGAIGRALGIPITDDRRQELPYLIEYYNSLGQAPITYPEDVQKYESIAAVQHFHPDTVIGAFITHKWKFGMENGNQDGVDEGRMLKMISRYIMVGNLNTHKAKPIRKLSHISEYHEWLITRGIDQKLNRIFIWDNK